MIYFRPQRYTRPHRMWWCAAPYARAVVGLGASAFVAVVEPLVLIWGRCRMVRQ